MFFRKEELTRKLPTNRGLVVLIPYKKNKNKFYVLPSRFGSSWVSLAEKEKDAWNKPACITLETCPTSFNSLTGETFYGTIVKKIT